MAQLVHNATLKFGTKGVLNEKEVIALWQAYDLDMNGSHSGFSPVFHLPRENLNLRILKSAGTLDREELRKLYVDMHKESVEKIKGELWEIQKTMIYPCNLFCCMNYLLCCVPCCHLNTAKFKLDGDLHKALPDIEADFTPDELNQLTKMNSGQFAPGNRVEAQWSKGIDEWHPAVIKEVKDDGTFVIEWEDGVVSDLEKTAKQLRPWYGMGTFKEMWVQLDENHDGKIDKSEFLRLGPKALRDSFDALILKERGVLAGLTKGSGGGKAAATGVDRLAARQEELLPAAPQM